MCNHKRAVVVYIMGAKLSVEQEASLLKFRECVVKLLQTGMEHTTIPSNNISMRRMRECLQQVTSLSMFMLVIFSRRWSEAITPLMEHGAPTIDTLDDYLDRFSKVSLKLPLNGSAKDVCIVMGTLPIDLKMEMVGMLLTSMMHIQQARLPPETPSETPSPEHTPRSTTPAPTLEQGPPCVPVEPVALPNNTLHIADIPHEVIHRHLPANRVPYQTYTFKIDNHLFCVTDV